MDIVLYTIDCPKCKVLESKLKSKNIQFEKCMDKDYMISHGMTTLPYLKVGNELLDFKQSINWFNNLEG